MSDLFYDFICGLYTLVNDTYLGIEVMSEPEDIKKHFDWCWKKTIDNFEKEGIYFNSDGNHRDYFWTFFEDSYYVHGSPIVYDKMNQFFTKLFRFTNRKTKSELDIYTDLYKMLEKNINYVQETTNSNKLGFTMRINNIKLD